MVVFPNAKINLGLNILRKRGDGYHELETCFYPIGWSEVLEIITSDKTLVTTSGIAIPEDGDNIILKACNLLKSDFEFPPVKIHLHKAIPIGAGLGGGSADAAFTIKLLNDSFSLNLEESKMMAYATQLGADCSFFIKNKPCLAAGIGENLNEINLNMTGKYIFMVYPNVHISTGEAYANIRPMIPEKSIKEVLKKYEMEEWKNHLINDFEIPIFESHPILKEIKAQLYEAGAVYASMSGSGSCMYGIFNEKPEIKFPRDYKIWEGDL